MPREWKRLWWGSGALVLGLALAVYLALPGSRNPRRAVLPDGSTLTLKAVSFGTNHYAPPKYLNFLLRQVPSGLAAKLRLGVPQVWRTPTPQLVTWWEWSNRTAAVYPGMFLLDDHGVVRGKDRMISVSGDPNSLLASWDSFPRRAEVLRLRVYQAPVGATPRLAAELRLANPVRGSFPRWTPKPLPISGHFDDVDVRLLGFQIEMARGLPGFDWCDSPQPWATLAFDITSGGRTDSNWRTDAFVLSDATGNEARLPGEAQFVTAPRAQPRIPRREAAGTNHVVSFLWPLGLDELAYRLRIEFVRQPDAPFPPGDLLEVKAVPVPAADGISMIDLHANLHGFEVGLLALVGEHATLPGREHDVFGQTTLEAEVPPLPDGLRFDVVEVRDDQGRRAEPTSGAGSQSYGFRIPEGARTVDLKLSLTKRFVVEFVAKPEIRSR